MNPPSHPRHPWPPHIPVLIARSLCLLTALLLPNAALALAPDVVPSGLEKSDWSGIKAEHQARQHEIQTTETGHAAPNPALGWHITWDHAGFLARPTAPTGDTWQWGLTLSSYGFQGAEQPISGTPATHADGQHLTYQWNNHLTEWYQNDNRGLEHGFTVAQRPPANDPSHQSHSSDLSFTLTVRGGLLPAISPDAQTVRFLNASGTTIVTYSGLKVWDADGKILPSHFAAADSPADTFRLIVDERGARYPITIDPLAQQAYLKPAAVGTTQAGDGFGSSVAVSGDFAVVGAPNEDSSTIGINNAPNEGAPDAGAAYVFVRNGNTWSQLAFLKASNPTDQDRFGSSVAISGNTIVVGAHGENAMANNAGAAYVFVWNGTYWSQQAYLKAGNPQADAFFGYSVAIAGDTLVVGAPQESSSSTGVNSTPNTSAREAGAAYVFKRSGTSWTQQAYLKASNTDAGDHFGNAVAISGETVVIGAPQEDSNGSSPTDNGATDAGAAYVFTRATTTWSFRAMLKGTSSKAGDTFGQAVAVDGTTLVVGAPGTNKNGGAAHVRVGSGAVWIFQQELSDGSMDIDPNPASFGSKGHRLGSSVAISGEAIIVGAPQGSGGGFFSSRSGRIAYVYTRRGTVWTYQDALPAASNSGRFGSSVALSNGTSLVGDPEENSSTTGVNSTPNELAHRAGAAYTFLFQPTAPDVVTQAATRITPHSATLNSRVYAGYSMTTMSFQYGVNPAGPLTTVSPTSPAVVSGNAVSFASYNLSGLVAGQTYRFRALGQNGVGPTNGAWLTFTTPLSAPEVVNQAATGVTHNAAVLNGTVLSKGSTTTVTFEYGPTGGLMQTIPAVPASVGGTPLTNTPTPVSAALPTLIPDTEYTFRVVAVNGIGTSVNPGDLTFRTLADPTASGALDPGAASVAIAGGGGSVYGTAFQPDGSTILVGDFLTVGGVAHNRIARLTPSGAVDTAFTTHANGDVICAAVLANGQILIGGNFTSVQRGAGPPFPRNRLALLNSDGSIDNSAGLGQLGVVGANFYVLSMAVQADGKILLAGDFTSLNGTPRNRIARITPTGVIESFNPNADGPVYAIAVQQDGKVLIGGAFGNVSGAAHTNLARLDATTGAAVAAYTASANTAVYCIALDDLDRAVVGGTFTSVKGVGGVPNPRNYLMRLTAAGALDATFIPNPNASIASIAIQANQDIIIGGAFGFVGPAARSKVARLRAAGTLDATFNPNVGGGDVRSVALRADGKVQLGGTFTSVGGTGRTAYAQVLNGVATSNVVKRDPTTVYWVLGGTSPQLQSVTFEKSTDGGATYQTLLGNGRRYGYSAFALENISPQLPGINNGRIRVRGRVAGGYLSGSAGMVENILTYNDPVATVTTIDPATEITGTTAVLYGTVNPNGNVTNAYFEISETPGFETPDYAFALSGSTSILTGSSNVVVTGRTDNFSATLQPGRLYYYRAAGYNTGGMVYGAAKTFTTLGNLNVDYKDDGSDNSPVASSYVATGRNVNFTLARALAAGTTLMVVNNTGSAPITGNFANLAQGQTVSLTYGGVSYPFVANYYGGTGNDLVLVWANTRMLAWGWDNGLQLGLGYQAPGGAIGKPEPVSPGALAGKTISTMAAGFLHSAALCVDGTVATWGSNLEGQLGDGTNRQRGIPNAVDFSFLPAGVQITAISAGYHHTLALASNGAVYAWGDNEFGQLGHGDVPNDSNLPVAVDASGILGGPGNRVVAIAAGARHSLAVLENGTVASWGWGSSGQLGNSGTANHSVPVGVDLSGISFGFGEKITLVAAGANHSLAATNDGRLLAWGNNLTGQLGDGTTTQRTAPVLISSVWTGGSPIVSLSAGGGGGTSDLGITGGHYFTTARAASGRMATWGSNVWGQLSDGNLGLVQTVPLWLADRGAVAESAGGSGHVLAIIADTLGAWGLGNEGRLGNGNVSTHVQPVPTEVASTLGAGERWLNVYGGSQAQHSLALVAGPPPPIVTTLAATAVSHNSVTLHGTVNANNNTASLLFQYGEDATYAVTTNVTAAPAALSGNVVTPITVTLSGLTPGTIYHFRAAATSGPTIATGADFTFTTMGDPGIAGTVDALDLGAGFNGAVYATAEQPDGKVVMGGAFSLVNLQDRNRLCRLNADGSLDTGFTPVVNGDVHCVAVQTDGSIVLGGYFTTVNGVARNHLARVDANGVLDASFDPNASSAPGFTTDVNSIALQLDGKILVGGLFTTFQANGAATVTSRQNCARLNQDGTVDPAFVADATSFVTHIAVQPDGSIILAGGYDRLNGVARSGLTRISASGAVDTTFDPNPNGYVGRLSLGADGSMVISGVFRSLQPGGTGPVLSRPGLARITAAGAVDAAYDADAGFIESMALQTNGQLLLGGRMTQVQGHGGAATPRGYVARLLENAALDTGFDPGANNIIRDLTLLSSGKVIINGSFTSLHPNGGPSYVRNGIARLNNDPITQSLTVTSANRVQWLRGGSAPETSQVTFELSIDGGSTFTPLGPASGYGAASRSAGGWELTGLSLPEVGTIRARARIMTNTRFTGSSGLVETLQPYSLNPPLAFAKPATDITDTTATLHAQVNPNSNPTTVSFSYGLSSSYEIGTAIATPDLITASGFTVVDAPIAGLLPGTVYHYTLNYGSSAGSGFTPDATFTTLTRLQAWRQFHFGISTSTSDAADSADPDNDGVANLTEFAFGLNPLKPDAAALPEHVVDGSLILVEFTEPDSHMGITYGAEWSPDMSPGSWSPLPDKGAGPVHSFKLNTSGRDRAFVRLKAAVTSP